MEFIDNLRYIKQNWQPYKKWDIEQQKLDVQNFELRKKLPPTQSEKDYAKNYGATLINTIDIMDQLSINKSENAKIVIEGALSSLLLGLSGLGALSGYLLSKFSKSTTKTPKIAAFIGYIISTVIGATVVNFASAHFDKMATRIARFQIRENELSNIENFVIYTDEQVAKAKEIAKTMSEVKDITADTTFKDSFNPITTYKRAFATAKVLKDDYAKYKNWHNEYRKQENQKPEKFANLNISGANLEQAEKDRDKILNTIKKLEISSNEYELNTHLACNALMISASFVTLVGGLLGSWGLSKLVATATKARKKTSVFEYLSKAAVPAGILSMIFLAGPVAKIAKESSRIGRHKEKENLQSDTTNFIAYSDKQKESVTNTAFEAKKELTFFQQLKTDLKNISHIKKDFIDYQKYKKSERQEELKLREALKTIKITDEQKVEAQKLQKQMFQAFEKVDDKAESFIDDTNAATTSIGRILACVLAGASNVATLLLFGKKLAPYTKNKKIPGFFEALKLSRYLKLKELALIFILPFAITRILCFGIYAMCIQINKKACKIGVMSAMQDLNNPKNFIVDNQQSGKEQIPN